MTTQAVEQDTARAVEVGDYFEASWGHDQTNVNWFRVVGFTPSGKSVRVQEWSSRTVDDNGPSTHVVPGDGPVVTREWEWDRVEMRRTGEFTDVVALVETKLIQWSTYGGKPEPYLAWRSYASLSRWDGKPSYVTGHGFGH